MPHSRSAGPAGGSWDEGVAVDSYENLILLCRVHHKTVDDQPNHYTVNRLRQIKSEHEEWVEERLTAVKLPNIHEPISRPLAMRALTTGAAVWQLVDGSEAYLLSSPSDGEVEEKAVDLADEFLEVCRDYGISTATSPTRACGRPARPSESCRYTSTAFPTMGCWCSGPSNFVQWQAMTHLCRSGLLLSPFPAPTTQTSGQLSSGRTEWCLGTSHGHPRAALHPHL